jgi:leader peptidase (prepilin peptidase)/N-methyltransferase
MNLFYFKILFVFCIGFKIGNSICKNLYIRLICALSLAFLFCKFSFSLQFLILSIFTITLLSVSVVDYFHRLIPVIASPVLFIVGLLFSFFNPVLGETYFFRFLNSILGVIAGGGILFLVGMLGEFFYKKEVIGGGDVKLMAGVGAFLGTERVLFAVFVASLLASIAGLILILFKNRPKETYIPFGPFLSLASFSVIFMPKPVHLITIFFTWEAKILGV